MDAAIRASTTHRLYSMCMMGSIVKGSRAPNVATQPYARGSALSRE